MGRRNGAHGLKLALRSDQREVVARDVGQHQQAHAAHAVLGAQRIRDGCLGTRAQAARKIDLPGNLHASAERFDIRRQLVSRARRAGCCSAGLPR